MKKSQLYAISYSYARKKAAEDFEKAENLKINYIFEFQEIYKTLGGFVNAYKSRQFLKAVKQAKEKATARKEQLLKCGCKSEKLTVAAACLAQIAILESEI